MQRAAQKNRNPLKKKGRERNGAWRDQRIHESRYVKDETKGYVQKIGKKQNGRDFFEGPGPYGPPDFRKSPPILKLAMEKMGKMQGRREKGAGEIREETAKKNRQAFCAKLGEVRFGVRSGKFRKKEKRVLPREPVKNHEGLR